MDRFSFVDLFKDKPEADKIIGFLKYRFKRGFATIILVIGARGTGKSSTCYRLSELINKELNPIREKQNLEKREIGKLVDSHLKNIEFIKNAQDGDDCILEEISVLYPSRRSMSDENVGFSQVLDIIRKKRLIIFANCPMALSSDKNIRSSANALILTEKIIKSEGIVVSRFWKNQPNYLSGKIYLHKFTREGVELDYMYTKKPDSKHWDIYEKKKDDFIDSQYERLLKKAELKQEAELKMLGYAKIERKPLTDKQKRVMEVRATHSGKETAVLIGLNEPNVSKYMKASIKKGYSLEEFKKDNQNES